MTRVEFVEKMCDFLESYISNGRTVDVEILKELNDHAVQTELYKTQKEKANFDDYSYDDVINHMLNKITRAPLLAQFTCVLCIPFVYEKYMAEHEKDGCE